jgi:pyrroloquinoline quinone biosynthesis protein D
VNVPLDIRPRLAPGCRLREAEGQAPLLLFPEGVLQLKGVGALILRLCDGKRTLAELIDELKVIFPAAGASVESETRIFLERLFERNFLQATP